MATNAQKKAAKKYIEKNELVEIKCRVSVEQREEFYNKIKELKYQSNNIFIIQAIEEKIARELN